MQQRHQELSAGFNALTHRAVGAAIAVHRVLGPGLLETAYSVCLAHELRKIGLDIQTEVPLPVVYDGLKLDAGYRLDMLVEGCLVVELKSVDAVARVHEAQVLTYMKLAHLPVGLLINFNVEVLATGIKRFKLAEFASNHPKFFSGPSGPLE